MIKTISTSIILFILVGCATSGMSVKEHNLINVFNTQKSHQDAAKIVADTSKYCESGTFVIEHKDFNSIGLSIVDLKAKHVNHYYARIEIETIDTSTSKVSVYHFQNTDITHQMGKAIEEWVTNNSKECVPGF